MIFAFKRVKKALESRIRKNSYPCDHSVEAPSNVRLAILCLLKIIYFGEPPVEMSSECCWFLRTNLSLTSLSTIRTNLSTIRASFAEICFFSSKSWTNLSVKIRNSYYVSSIQIKYYWFFWTRHIGPDLSLWLIFE